MLAMSADIAQNGTGLGAVFNYAHFVELSTDCRLFKNVAASANLDYVKKQGKRLRFPLI